MDMELVGFDADVENITKYLTRGTGKLRVISIVGMAGIGKTAVARMIYNSRSIKYNFDFRAWCTVSQSYNTRELLIEIIRRFSYGDHHEYVEVDCLEEILQRLLFGKRYLIVLDDMWAVRAWDELQICFPDCDNGSRILVTIRNEYVARRFSDPYLLPFLEPEKSWELLEKRLFQGENNSCPPELRNVGRLVAKQCKGLPLLILMTAGVLRIKEREPSLWLKFARDLSSQAFEEEMTKIVQLSYDHLPDQLKHCLLYMGLFPESYEIPVSDLLKWWIAEEFVQDTGTLMLEELSENYLNDLVASSLVVVSKTRSNGKMKCCTVHDQVRRFCLRQITEEKLMQPIRQRICMYIRDTITSDDFKESREFIVHPKFTRLDHKNPFRLLNNLTFVRVLHLLDIYLDNSWASAFRSLPHLRYLAIFVKAFVAKWVSHLLHLQTLRVRSSYIMISPALWKMSQLRHVDINEFPITISCKEEDDIVLHNLRTLGLCYMSVADMTHNFWDKFPNLELLKLHIKEFGYHVPLQIIQEMNFDAIFPSCLRSLSLTEIFLTDEIVSSIANLQNLETLKLSEIYFTGEKHWDLIGNKFEKLEFLKLNRVFMNRWSFSEESFPRLEYLVVKSCSKLEEFPDTFMEIVTLRSIKVIDCSDSVGDSAVKIKEELEDCTGSSFQLHILKKDE